MSTGSTVSVEVPDIGDFEDVPIVEVLVSPGDSVAAEDPLVTLESDKATMDVPAPFAGVIADVQVKVGDRVSQGAPLLTIEPGEDGSMPAADEAEADEAEAAEAEADEPSHQRPPRPSQSLHRLPQATAGDPSTPAPRCVGWPESSGST